MRGGFKLRSCVWELTLACCFSCKYCGSSGGRARPNELTTEECLNVAEQLADLGCDRVSLIGGEGFLRPDWVQIARHIHDLGMRSAVITNGFLFADKVIRQLKEARVEAVAVSLDGTEAIHDRYRQTGSYRRAIQAIEALSGAGIPVSVISTLNRESVGCLEELYAVLRRYPLYAWQLQACSPMGNAALSGVDFRFDPREVIAFVERRLTDAPFAVGVADNIGYFTPGEGALRGNPSGRGCCAGCSAGLTAIGIDSVGNVRGCESMYDEIFNEGNLRETTLRQIWESPYAFAYNRLFTRNMLTGHCADCPEGARCAGGCRSYNFFVHKKLYESPACARWYTGPED